MQGRYCLYASLVSLVLGTWETTDYFDRVTVPDQDKDGACRLGSKDNPLNPNVADSGVTNAIWNQVIYMGNQPQQDPNNTLDRSVEVCTKICAAATDCKGIEAHLNSCEYWLETPLLASENVAYQCWAKKQNATDILMMKFGFTVSTLVALKSLKGGIMFPNVKKLLEEAKYLDYNFLACGHLETQKLEISVWVKNSDTTKIKSMANFLSPPTREDDTQQDIFDPLKDALKCDLSKGESADKCIEHSEYANLTVAGALNKIENINHLKRDVVFVTDVPQCTDNSVKVFATKDGKGLSEAVNLNPDDGDTNKQNENEASGTTFIMRTRCGFVSLIMAWASVVLG